MFNLFLIFLLIFNFCYKFNFYYVKVCFVLSFEGLDEFYFINFRFILFVWRWLILISIVGESFGYGGGGDGDLVRFVFVILFVELLIFFKDLLFVI